MSPAGRWRRCRPFGTAGRRSGGAADESGLREIAGRLYSLKKEKKTAAPPKLFDLTTLQREANRIFGYTAKQTLDYAQSLYEKKLITYPRTDSDI